MDDGSVPSEGWHDMDTVVPVLCEKSKPFSLLQYYSLQINYLFISDFLSSLTCNMLEKISHILTL